ncbi:hypothetical protein DJ536_21910 [Enterobacter hormaechei]|nr:hypothetical protein DJ536_21910 [Enterobacter hormaechei]
MCIVYAKKHSCIGFAYADAKGMRMPYLCRCLAYGYVMPILFFLFLREDPKKAKVGSPDYSRVALAKKA